MIMSQNYTEFEFVPIEKVVDLDEIYNFSPLQNIPKRPGTHFKTVIKLAPQGSRLTSFRSC
jgi:hypothetical protein